MGRVVRVGLGWIGLGCRVSEMRRVTMNGGVAGDPGVKVDILTDVVVAAGKG